MGTSEELKEPIKTLPIYASKNNCRWVILRQGETVAYFYFNHSRSTLYKLECIQLALRSDKVHFAGVVEGNYMGDIGELVCYITTEPGRLLLPQNAEGL